MEVGDGGGLMVGTMDTLPLDEGDLEAGVEGEARALGVEDLEGEREKELD